ncbi:MAG: heavy-metal-associated domain-containing protein [Thiohalocapsa sp.]
MYNGDMLIHIDEALDDDQIHELERSVSLESGVLSACFHERTRHLMVVDFDANSTRPSDVLRMVRGRGLNAEMVGL